MKRREKVNGTLSPRSQARDQGWSIQPQLPPLQCQPPAPSLQSYQPWEISPKSQSPDSVLSHKQYQFMIEWDVKLKCYAVLSGFWFHTTFQILSMNFETSGRRRTCILFAAMRIHDFSSFFKWCNDDLIIHFLESRVAFISHCQCLWKFYMLVHYKCTLH